MIGFFKGRKQEERIDIRDTFNWVDGIDKQRLDLSGQGFEERLTEIKSVHQFLKSEDGKRLIQSLHDDMIGIGFLEESTKIELGLLSEIFSPETLNLMFFNPSNGLGNSFHQGAFNDTVKVDESYSYLVVPKGLILGCGQQQHDPPRHHLNCPVLYLRQCNRLPAVKTERRGDFEIHRRHSVPVFGLHALHRTGPRRPG